MTTETTSAKTGVLKITRREFLRALGCGGLTVLFADCNVTLKEKEEMPLVTLDELALRPDFYSLYPLVRTMGYPEQTGKRLSLSPIKFFPTLTDTYRLHSEPDAKSKSVDLMIRDGVTYFPIVPLQPKGSTVMLNDRYEVTGKMIETTDQDAETKKYMLRPSSVRKVVSPTPLPAK